MSFITGMPAELIYVNDSPGTAKASFTSEVAINDQAGMGPQVFLPQGFFTIPAVSRKGIKVVARGILGSVSGTAAIYTFTLRGGTAGNTAAAILAGSGALTSIVSVTNKLWEFEADIVFNDPAGSGAAMSGRGAGMVKSPGGLASTMNEVWGGGAQPGTFSTFDPTIANFLNFNVTCSVSNAANTIQLLQLLVYGLN